MLKKIAILLLFFFSITSRAQPHDIVPWEIATKDDGYYQLLGKYDPKRFIVYVSELHHGKPSDTITVECNAGNDSFERHEVPAGATIECYPHYQDVIAIYIDKFQYGAEGTFSYEPCNKSLHPSIVH